MASAPIDPSKVALALRHDIKATRASELLTVALPTLSIDDAYAVSDAMRRLRQEVEHEEVIGYKIGCTGLTIRQKLGIPDAVFGILWREEQHPSGSKMSLGSFHGLAIEGELAVRILSTDGPVSGWRVAYTPIIELHHAHFDGPAEYRAVELISRNCIHAGVIRDWGDAPECALSEIPLDVPLKVSFNDRLLEEPLLKNLAMGENLGPVATVTWLVEKLAQNGEKLKVGDVVLTATPGDLIPVEEAIEISVEFGGRIVRCFTEVSETRAVADGVSKQEARVASSLSLIREELEEELTEFRAFWEKAGIDKEHGGFICSLDHNGDRVGSEKFIWYQVTNPN